MSDPFKNDYSSADGKTSTSRQGEAPRRLESPNKEQTSDSTDAEPRILGVHFSSSAGYQKGKPWRTVLKGKLVNE